MEKESKFHGSDLEYIEQHYHIPRAEIMSFSSNVNPLGISPLFKKSLAEHIDAITSYPDRAYSDLRSALGEYCNISPEYILVGSGATDLISRFIKETLPHKVLILEPTYSEYVREVELEGGQFISFPLLEKEDFCLNSSRLLSVLDDTFDLLILCNPNNPTGTALTQSTLRPILEQCKKHNIYVLIDETYIEFSPQLEQITAIPLTAEFDDLFVIRGVSKFFAAPGLRLGYAITGNLSLIQSINSKKNPWGINTYAAVCGAEMFRDQDYIFMTRDFVQREMARIISLLHSIKNLCLYEPAANFILLKILKEGLTSSALFEAAIRKGLMIRDCSSFPGLGENHIRFCLCMPDENDRLINLLIQQLK